MKYFIKYFLILCLIGITFSSCSKKKNTDSDSIIAQVGDYILKINDVVPLLPNNISKEDSIAFIKNYVDNWVRSKILYDIALDKISDKEGVIEDQVNRFREELYVNTYEQLFSQQKLDTLISQNLIDDYYNLHKDEYILRTNVVKPIFIVLSKKKDVKKVTKLFFSTKSDDLDNLKDYCFQNSSKFYFGNQWVDFNNLKQEIPIQIVYDEELFNPKGIILEDSLNLYFVKITEHLTPGQKTPKELIYTDIAKILLHKRRIELIQNMRNKVYQDALHKKQFEVNY